MARRNESTTINDDEFVIIEKIKSSLEKDDIVIFSNDEVRVIRDMITVYQMISAFGRMGSLFKNIMVGLAAFIGAYYVVQNWGVGMLKHLLGI